MILTISVLQLHAQFTQPNILFIYVDDMNDYVQGFEGHPQAQTPAMQILAENGTVFLNAHASSPKCMPSRTSTITGKDPYYTDVYRNKACKPLQDYVDGELFVLPEFMKDSVGYFTFGTGKILHCFDSYPEYDNMTSDACAKNLSWNKYVMFPDGENPAIVDLGNATNLGLKGMKWAIIPDSLEHNMWDYQSTDSLISFIQKTGNGKDITCGKPLFMMLGFHKPHQTLYIPEKYFSDDFVIDFYNSPFNKPYNFPPGTYPYNGVVMPPQPETIYQDFYDLPQDSLGQYFASFDNFYKEFDDEVNAMHPLPDIESFDDNTVKEILNETLRANFVLAYLAAIRFVDAQILRLLETLQQYPEMYNNTIVVLISDHGYALGEKRHWQKGTMWETDIRVPMVIADLRNPKSQTVSSMVSLLDLFPTLCDFAGAEYPVFSDGTKYLDGHSLTTLIQSPEKNIEEIALGSYAQQPDQGQGSCFPAYSIRSDRFHYIRYTSNNTGWELECNNAQAWSEEELYEIGIDRSTDPYEWNNLINKEDYSPVKKYLKQWLPNSNMYLQRTYKATIRTSELQCFSAPGDRITLIADIADTLGNIIDAPDSYILRWTNNYYSDTLYGDSVAFYIDAIDPDFYANNSRVMYYFEIFDTVTETILALDIKYIYINPENTPEIFFTIDQTNFLQAEIEQIEVEGSYNVMQWDYGDGNIFTTDNPGPYSYQQPGEYYITGSLYYGNNPQCFVNFTQAFNAILPTHPADNDWVIFPNPAQDYILVYDSAISDDATFIMYDSAGKLIQNINANGVSGFYSINVHELHPGLYFLTFNNGEEIGSKPFIVLH